MSQLKHVNINNCDGATVFLKALKKNVDFETFIFTATEDYIDGAQFVGCQEKIELIDFVRSMRNLKVLCLNYIPRPSTSPDEVDETSEDDEAAESTDISDDQKPLQDEVPLSSSPESQQVPEVYCNFPLMRLLTHDHEYSLHSIALTQQQRQLSKADLIFSHRLARTS